MSGWVETQLGLLIIFYLVTLIILSSNLAQLRPLERFPGSRKFPRVSLLVPVRNEERSLEACLRSLLAQDYPNFEVLVLNDHSTDSTPGILARLEQENPLLRVIPGAALPPGWLGKHWACQQLLAASCGELLLYTDADTEHHPRALADSVAALQHEQADMLTALPREIIGSWGERLTVPIFLWGFLCFQPLLLIHRTRLRAISVAVGQFMLFRRSALEAIGSFASIKSDVADDLALARGIRRAGFRLVVADGKARVQCRMYHGFREAWDGFSKNLFAAFRYNLFLFVFVWLFFLVATWGPLAVLLFSFFWPITPILQFLAGSAFLLSFLLWLIVCLRTGLPWTIALFHPLIILVAVLIAARSLSLTYRGRANWKGRQLKIDTRREPSRPWKGRAK